MSVYAARRALLWKGGTQTERHVLAVIGIDGDKDTDWATVTLEEIADEVGCHRATAARAIAALFELGVLEREGSGGRNPSRYRVAGHGTQPPTVASGATVQEPPTVAQPSHNRRITVASDAQGYSYRDRDRDREPPLPPERPAEVIRPELLPAPTPNGAGEELIKGQQLDTLIAAVSERRQPPLTRPQAIAARKLARECLDKGWDPRVVVAALIVTAAFTQGAFDFAVSKLRRDTVGELGDRLTPFEQQQRRRPR